MEKRTQEGLDLGPRPRILALRFRAIGDCVMAAWAVSALRQALPEASITWGVEKSCAAVLDREHLVNHLVELDRARWKAQRWSPATWAEQVRLYLGFRKMGFDAGIDFQGHSKTALALRLSGARIRISAPGTDALARALNPSLASYPHRGHQVQMNLALVRALAPSAELPALPWMPEFDAPGPGVVLNCGASIPEKAIPLEAWRGLAEHLVALGHPVTLIGGPRDPGFELPGVQNRVGQTSLAETCGILRTSTAHFCGDTGTGHIAAAYGVPTCAVFMSHRNSPERYAPFGPKATYLSTVEDPGCLNPETWARSVLQ